MSNDEQVTEFASHLHACVKIRPGENNLGPPVQASERRPKSICIPSVVNLQANNIRKD
jgi:hypothetical protein